MKSARDFEDRWGVLDKHYYPDGGDSAHREGVFWSLGAMMGIDPAHQPLNYYSRDNSYFEVMKKIHVNPGVIVRHPNFDYDASDWDRMSRDQFQPNIIAAGYWSRVELRKMAWGHLQRGFLFTNNVRQNGATKRNHGQPGYSYAWKLPDITGPEIWSNFIRSFRAWIFWPALILFDLELLGGAIKWRWFPKHNIALNHTLSQMQAIDIMPTPISWLASKVMPVPRLIEICKDHLDDTAVDMPFLGQMYYDAYQKIK